METDRDLVVGVASGAEPLEVPHELAPDLLGQLLAEPANAMAARPALTTIAGRAIADEGARAGARR